MSAEDNVGSSSKSTDGHFVSKSYPICATFSEIQDL